MDMFSAKPDTQATTQQVAVPGVSSNPAQATSEPSTLENMFLRDRGVRTARRMVIVVSFALICTNAWLVLDNRTQILAQANQANMNLARAVAERVGSSIADVDHILHAIAFELERSGVIPNVVNRLPPLLDAQAHVAAQISALYVYSHNGRLLASSLLSNSGPPDALDDDFLQRQSTSANDLMLGAPYRSPHSGEWVFSLSRRIDNAQGKMLGVVVATLSIHHFRAVLDRFEMGKDAAITLTLERRILVRRPYREAHIGVLASEPILQKLYRGQSSGTDEEISPVDGMVRLYSYDTVEKYPLRITVAAGKSEVLHSWHSAALLQTVWVSFLCIILWLSATWIQILMRRQSATEAGLRKARDALAHANIELSHLAQYDGLTGLPNRRFFDTRLPQVFRHAQRHQRSMAVVMIDVDEFKRYNDLYGHVAGDECLRQVAQALRATVARPQDFVARYGGEEIVLLLPETGLDGATQVAEASRHAVAALQIAHAASPLAKVTISVGVASWLPSAAESPYAMVESADAALYEAKKAGKNRVSSVPTYLYPLTETQV